MLNKNEVREKALELGFCDIGFTGAEPFDSQRNLLAEREESYAWLRTRGMDIFAGTDPETFLAGAKSVIVVLNNYYQASFPASMTGKFGRCYLDDDRMTRDGAAIRLKQFRGYLKENGIQSAVPGNMPHRLSAARAGVGTFGKNCLLYASHAARGSSWVIPTAFVVDCEFEPDRPTVQTECPTWCKNACIAACPTGALRGPGKLEPRRCISYLSYYSEEITPPEFREPMGMWIYGCDRCQQVCPRNEPWLAQELPANERVQSRAAHFDLVRLLHMDREYFKTLIWPHMFYTSGKDLWRWKMNAARVMGNSRDARYVPELIEAYRENEDPRVRGMIAWALGKLGGAEARTAIESFLADSEGLVRDELEHAAVRLQL